MHTPGPWIESSALVIADGHCVATIHSRDACGPEFEANASLIAAAPDLLEALKDLVARCDGDEGVRADGSNIDTAWAHAVIAKAEGGDA